MKDPEWYADPYGDLLRAWKRRLDDIVQTWDEQTYEDGRAAALVDCIDELAEVRAKLLLRKEHG